MARCKLTLVDVGDGKGAVWHMQSYPPLLTPEQEEGMTALEVRASRTLAQSMLVWGLEGIFAWIRLVNKCLGQDYHTKQDELPHKPTNYLPGAHNIALVRSVCTLIIIDGADGKVHYRYKCVPRHFPTVEEAWNMQPDDFFERLTPALNYMLAAISGMNAECARLGLFHKVSPEADYSV